MAKPIEWSETVHQDITQTVRMTVTRTWTDKYGTPHREDKPPTFADLVAVLGLMPADERVAVVGPLIGDALALQWESALTAATARAEKAERVAEERENIIKAQATEIDRARDRWDEAIKRTDVAETRLSRLRERGVQITGRVCSPISDDAIYYAEMLGLVVEDRDVLRTKLAAVEKERDSYRDALNAMTRGATQGAELIHRLEKERDDLRTKLREVELERDDRREVFALVRDQRDARTALSYKLEAALGQAEKELHECRVALKDALGGLDSVKDQNADLRRQLRRLQTGTEIESDRLTDVELNLQATVDRVRAERDEAINALRAAEAKMEPGRGAGGG